MFSMKKNFIGFVYCCVILLLSNCATLIGEKAKDDALKAANTKAQKMGLKVGSACKYLGFIGDNSEQKATANGSIKIKLFSVKNVGGIIKSCTYVYGKDKLF